MTKLSWFQRITIKYFSRPVSDRAVLVHLLSNPVGSILEIGIGNGTRTRKILALAQIPVDVAQLRYVGIDPFESAKDGRPHLKLKEAHRMLAEFKVKTHLLPGDVSAVLPRVSRTAPPSDLVIVDGGWGETSETGELLAYWLPRLSSERATVFASQKTGEPLQKIAIQRAGLISRAA